MARVADYVIIRDAWKVDDGSTNPIKFSVPGNIDRGSRCVLNFMFKVDTSDDMTLNILINGDVVWTWHATGAQDPPIRAIQEVVAANIVHPGENLLQFVWFQANI